MLGCLLEVQINQKKQKLQLLLWLFGLGSRHWERDYLPSCLLLCHSPALCSRAGGRTERGSFPSNLEETASFRGEETFRTLCSLFTHTNNTILCLQ